MGRKKSGRGRGSGRARGQGRGGTTNTGRKTSERGNSPSKPRGSPSRGGNFRRVPLDYSAFPRYRKYAPEFGVVMPHGEGEGGMSKGARAGADVSVDVDQVRAARQKRLVFVPEQAVEGEIVQESSNEGSDKLSAPVPTRAIHCPICNEAFDVDVVDIHASRCEISIEKKKEDKKKKKRGKAKESEQDYAFDDGDSVIRDYLDNLSMQQLQEEGEGDGDSDQNDIAAYLQSFAFGSQNMDDYGEYRPFDERDAEEGEEEEEGEGAMDARDRFLMANEGEHEDGMSFAEFSSAVYAEATPDEYDHGGGASDRNRNRNDPIAFVQKRDEEEEEDEDAREDKLFLPGISDMYKQKAKVKVKGDKSNRVQMTLFSESDARDMDDDDDLDLERANAALLSVAQYTNVDITQYGSRKKKKNREKGKSEYFKEIAGDLIQLNDKLRQYVIANGGFGEGEGEVEVEVDRLAFPPMHRRLRKAFHELCLLYDLKSKSYGSGKNRYPTVKVAGGTHVAPEQDVRRLILRYLKRSDQASEWNADGKLGKRRMKKAERKKHRMSEWADSSDECEGGGGGDGKGKDKSKSKTDYGYGISEYLEKTREVAGDAPAIGEDNRGFRLLKLMGWDGAGGLGADEQGRTDPISVEIRRSRRGLGNDF